MARILAVGDDHHATRVEIFTDDETGAYSAIYSKSSEDVGNAVAEKREWWSIDELVAWFSCDEED